MALAVFRTASEFQTGRGSDPEQNLAMGDKPSVNPAHGEPWHNCSVKVGDPLP